MGESGANYDLGGDEEDEGGGGCTALVRTSTALVPAAPTSLVPHRAASDDEDDDGRERGSPGRGDAGSLLMARARAGSVAGTQLMSAADLFGSSDEDDG